MVCITLLSCMPFQQVVADEPVTGYPFQLRLKRVEERPSITSLLNTTEDLRLLFVDLKIVERRVASSTVVLDFGDSHRAFEIKLKGKTTVKEVLNQSPLAGWRGESQLKLVQKDAILQTPFPLSSAQPGKVEEFLAMEMSPGDCLMRLPTP